MKTQGGRADIVGSLERTEKALIRILKSVNAVDSRLKVIESEFAKKQTDLQLDFIPGSAGILVYSMGGKTRGDPIGEAVRRLAGTGQKLPSFILGSDRSESQETCRSVLQLMKRKSNDINIILGLRWTKLPPPLDKTSTIVIGTRFQAGTKRELSKLRKGIEEGGFNAVEDYGEFGGGAMAFSLVRDSLDIEGIVILELTMDSALASNNEKMGLLLKLLSGQ